MRNSTVASSFPKALPIDAPQVAWNESVEDFIRAEVADEDASKLAKELKASPTAARCANTDALLSSPS